MNTVKLAKKQKTLFLEFKSETYKLFRPNLFQSFMHALANSGLEHNNVKEFILSYALK